MRESRYIELQQFQASNKLSIMSLNAQSINNKFQKIRDATHKIAPVALCIQETWGKNKTTDYSIRGYHKPEFVVRKGESMNLGGGVATWVRDDIDFEVWKSPFIEKIIETQTLHLPELNIIIVNVYRPFGSFETFIDNLHSHIGECVKREPQAHLILTGDFNVNLLQEHSQAKQLLEYTLDHNMLQRVTLPTRITEKTETLIDHAYLRSKADTQTGVIVADFSDHFIILTTFLNKRRKRVKQAITK